MHEMAQFRDSDGAGVHMEWGVKVPLRDGIQLNATLYRPRDHAAPSPVIFTLTPYISQTYHDQGVYFATQGYPFLTVDVRGRGNSEGVFDPNINEGKDGHDVVGWLARQPFCNGKVAMWGGSYAGLNQWNTAREFPPHLSTIVPVASPFIGVDFPIRNNIPSPYLMQWLTLVAGRTSQEKIFDESTGFWGTKFRDWFESGRAFNALDTWLGHSSAIFQEWVAHPHQDNFWDNYNPAPEHYARMSIPVLTITGIYDGDQPGALMHYREHLKHHRNSAGSEHYLVIGPWDHSGTRNPKSEFVGIKVGPASLVDLRKLHLQWYNWTMKGGPKPDFLEKKVSYYVMGAERWRYADTLEGVTARMDPLYLRSCENPTDVFKSGSLDAELPLTGEPDHYVYDPTDTALAALESTVNPENRADPRMVYASVGRSLIYHSAPFQKDTEISGFFTLSVWLSIDQPDTDFCASIYEIDLEGSSTLLTNDLMRARYRESLREAVLIRNTEPLRYDFNRFMFVSREIRRGHRLRLVIGPLNSIYKQRNSNAGGVVAEETLADARPVNVKLFHDQLHASALYVPLGTTEVS